MQIKESLLREFIKQSLLNEITREDWNGPVGQELRDILKNRQNIKRNPYKQDNDDDLFLSDKHKIEFNRSGAKSKKLKDLKNWWNENADHDFFNNKEDLKNRKEKVVVIHNLTAYAYQDQKKGYNSLDSFIKEKEKIYKDLKNKFQKNELSALGFINHKNLDAYEICKNKIGQDSSANPLNMFFYLNPRRITHASQKDSSTDIFSDYPAGNPKGDKRYKNVIEQINRFRKYLKDEKSYKNIENNINVGLGKKYLYDILYEAIHYNELKFDMDDIRNYFKNNKPEITIEFFKNIKESPTFQKDKEKLIIMCEDTIKFLFKIISEEQYKELFKKYIKIPSFIYYIGREINNPRYLELAQTDLENIESHEDYNVILSRIYENSYKILIFFHDRNNVQGKKPWFNSAKYFQDFFIYYFNKNAERFCKYFKFEKRELYQKFYPVYAKDCFIVDKQNKRINFNNPEDYENYKYEIQKEAISQKGSGYLRTFRFVNEDDIVEDKEKLKKIIFSLLKKNERPDYFDVTKNSGTRKTPMSWSFRYINTDTNFDMLSQENVLSREEVEDKEYLGELVIGNWKPDSVWFSLVNVENIENEIKRTGCTSFKEYIQAFENYYAKKEKIRDKEFYHQKVEESEKLEVNNFFKYFKQNDIHEYLLQLYHLYFFSMQGLTCFDKNQNRFYFSSHDFEITKNIKDSEIYTKTDNSNISKSDIQSQGNKKEEDNEEKKTGFFSNISNKIRNFIKGKKTNEGRRIVVMSESQLRRLIRKNLI